MSTLTKPRTVWFGMKLTPEQKAKIKRLAQREGTTAKAAILNLVSQAMEQPDPVAQPGSFLNGIQHLVGSVQGPTDLSTNPNHMRGFGQ